MKHLILLALALFTGCQDRYRYYCQDPENFAREQCQKPKCQFTQTCPEYLVAPILEKHINAQPTVQAAPEASAANR
jgi:hypothetical protein